MGVTGCNIVIQIHLTFHVLLLLSLIIGHVSFSVTNRMISSLSSFVSRSDPFRSFVDYCLLKIPQDRPSSGELLKVSARPLFNLPTVTSLPVSVSPRGWVTASHPRLPDYNTGAHKHTTTCTRTDRTHRHRQSYWAKLGIVHPTENELLSLSFSQLLTISSFLFHAFISNVYTTKSHQHIPDSTPKYSWPNRLCMQTKTKQTPSTS